MQNRSPLDTGFLAPQFSLGSRSTERETAVALEDTQLFDAPAQGSTLRFTVIEQAFQASLGRLGQAAAVPTVVVRRSRLAAHQAQAQKEEVPEKQGRVFVRRNALSVESAQTAAQAEASRAPLDEPFHKAGPKQRRRRTPDYKKPGAGVLIKPHEAVGLSAVNVVASDGPESIASLEKALKQVSIPGLADRLVFDLTFATRWSEVTSAIESLSASVAKLGKSDRHVFMVPGRRHSRA